MARARQEDPITVRLSDGTIARVVRSGFTTGWELDVDGTPQSHVDLDDPTHLHFEYVARMGAVIDRLRMPGQPLTAVHLGAGALTLPRYIEATRPGPGSRSSSSSRPSWNWCATELPLPKGASIRVRVGDARAVLGSCRRARGFGGSARLGRVRRVPDAGARHLGGVPHGGRADAGARRRAARERRRRPRPGVRAPAGGDDAGRAGARRRARGGAGAEGPPLRQPGDRRIRRAAAHRVAPPAHGGGPAPGQGGEGAELDDFARGARVDHGCRCRRPRPSPRRRSSSDDDAGVPTSRAPSSQRRRVRGRLERRTARGERSPGELHPRIRSGDTAREDRRAPVQGPPRGDRRAALAARPARARVAAQGARPPGGRARDQRAVGAGRPDGRNAPGPAALPHPARVRAAGARCVSRLPSTS